jgi:hypothetical protein
MQHGIANRPEELFLKIREAWNGPYWTAKKDDHGGVRLDGGHGEHVSIRLDSKKPGMLTFTGWQPHGAAERRLEWTRLSISCSYGYQDFATFKQAMADYGIKRLVTGHQHAASGFDDHPEWAKNGHDALTLTGFGFADAYDRPDSYGVNYRRTLTVGRCRPDQIPEVVTIPVHEQDLMSFCDAEIKTMPRFAIS